jgi:hypothetical protein
LEPAARFSYLAGRSLSIESIMADDVIAAMHQPERGSVENEPHLSPQRPDCVAGHMRLELRNPSASYLVGFE